MESRAVMRLSEALDLIRKQPNDGQAQACFLACGFQPLHLSTFLQAHLGVRFPGRRVVIESGHYGDLEGTLVAAAQSGREGAVVVEWSDLDPRLGLRGTGGWGPSVERDILETSQARCARLFTAISDAALRTPVVLSGPSLVTPLFGHTPGWQLSSAEAELQSLAARFLADAALIENVAVLNPARLTRLSTANNRLDERLELTAGFPYTLDHASALASQLVNLLYPPPPMKGLITDLDDTLWSGIVGEVGAGEVSWSVADRTQIHGLYQQQLRQLSEIGVLLAIVSKNEPAVVEEALARSDLYIQKEAFFPVCVSWNQKSKAVAEVINAWNVGPESIVFVDDNPLELEEVGSEFPTMTCLRFPERNPHKALELFAELRDLFGKPNLQAEDKLRQTSIRANERMAASRLSGGDFVRSLQGKINFSGSKSANSRRVLELINKTNQFNLNGARLTAAEWRKLLVAHGSVVAAISYEDKFGPLGVIGAIAGTMSGKHLTVCTWVLSCRAFSRKIEHHTLDFLFSSTGATTIAFSFRPTERNKPLRVMFKELGISADSECDLLLDRDQFDSAGISLPHVVSRQELIPLAKAATA